MKKKTVGIYDRWLHTLGGGEQVAFAYAEVLRDLGYAVTLISHTKIDIPKAEKKMNINLDDISLRVIPSAPDFMLATLSDDFDLFICNSYLDYIPPTNPNSMLSLFFPTQVSMSLYDHLYKRGLFRVLQNMQVYPIKYHHFLYDDFSENTVRKWCSNKSQIEFTENVQKFSITMYFEYLSAEILESSRFFIQNKEIKPSDIQTNIEKNTVRYTFTHDIHKGNIFSFAVSIKMFANKMAVTSVTIHSPKYLLYNVLKSIFPTLEMRLSGGFSFSSYANIAKYKQIFVISQFSQQWLKNYWNLESELLYPPVSVDSFKPSKKRKNQIVHIGRFFTDGHNKKQLELAQEFIKMCEDGLSGWELHFIGSIAEGFEHQKYFKEIQEIAKKYPIVFHIDAPFKELKKVLSESKIYWHATGLDVNEKTSPIKLEHFGITTVEAMASGCVPVVIDKGGQSEIVTPESGYTWNTREEMQSMTQGLISDDSLRVKMSQAAIKRSTYFSKENFKQRLEKLLINNAS